MMHHQTVDPGLHGLGQHGRLEKVSWVTKLGSSESASSMMAVGSPRKARLASSAIQCTISAVFTWIPEHPGNRSCHHGIGLRNRRVRRTASAPTRTFIMALGYEPSGLTATDDSASAVERPLTDPVPVRISMVEDQSTKRGAFYERRCCDNAPDFTMPTDGGGEVSLAGQGAENRAHFTRDDTPGCTKEANGFKDMMDDFKAAGAEIIGVSRDTVAKHDKFKAKYDLNFTLGADETGAVTEAYGVWVEKSMYGKKSMGIERSTFLIGADGKIAQVWRKAKVPGHVEAVLEAVKAQ